MANGKWPNESRNAWPYMLRKACPHIAVIDRLRTPPFDSYLNLYLQMERTKKVSKLKGKSVSMTVVNPNVAGVDISDTIHAVALPGDSVQTPAWTFGTMSCNLDEIADWLQQYRIDTVAMESTGVYWKPLLGLLIHRGIEVFLVNANHVIDGTGRKTDIDEATWIQQLHSCGLLRSSYLPSENQESLRI